MVYIPIVPESVIESLQEAPITFIMGYVIDSSNIESFASFTNTDNNKIPDKNNHLSISQSTPKIGESKKYECHSRAMSSASYHERNGGGHTRDGSRQQDFEYSINDVNQPKPEEEILYVNLDSDEIFIPSGQRVRIPYESRLRNDLRKILYHDFPSENSDIYLETQEDYTINIDTCVESIRKCFYHWFVTILYNYQSFYIDDGDFNVTAFRSRFSDDYSEYINVSIPPQKKR